MESATKGSLYVLPTLFTEGLPEHVAATQQQVASTERDTLSMLWYALVAALLLLLLVVWRWVSAKPEPSDEQAVADACRPRPHIPAASARRGAAVVIGGGMGGMLTARVLADYFEKVTVIDRDVLDCNLEQPQTRSSVPQSRSVHLLMYKVWYSLRLVSGCAFDYVTSSERSTI